MPMIVLLIWDGQLSFQDMYVALLMPLQQTLSWRVLDVLPPVTVCISTEMQI